MRQHSTSQHSTAQYSTAQHNTAQLPVRKPAAAQQDGDCANTTSTAAPASQGSQDVFNKIHPCTLLTAAQL